MGLDDLRELANSRPWEERFSHWGEAFVYCFFPELDVKEHLKRPGASLINGEPCILIYDGLTVEEARQIVKEHNEALN